jgi:competence protein ComEA
MLKRSVPLAWLLLACIAAAAAGLTWFLVLSAGPPSNAVLIESEPQAQATVQPADGNRASSTQARTPATIVVYVSGGVNRPGVYTLPAGSRVDDAVKAAGGLTADADMEQINLAAPLADAEHVSVTPKGATPIAQTVSPTKPPVASAPSAAPRDKVATSAPQASSAPHGKVNINTATAAELEILPGIGSALAQRIVDYRNAHGPFKTPEDLMQVPGIKEGIFSQIADFITVGP